MIQVNSLQQDIYVITEDDEIVLVESNNNSPSLSFVLNSGNNGGGQQIKNIGDPTQNQDVVTLAYFNQHGGGSVTSVFGRTGEISASNGDYNTSQVTELSNLYFTTARAISALTSNTISSNINFASTFGIDSANILNIGPNTLILNLGIGALNTNINIGTSGTNIIQIGNNNSTVNILGSVLYENVSQLQVSDKLITINKGGASSSGSGSGFEIEENGSITGYIKTTGVRDGFLMRAPANFFDSSFILAPSAARSYTFPNVSGTMATVDGGQSYTNVASVSIAGTGGNGFMNLASQSSDPAQPSSSVNIFSNSSNHLSWKTPSDNFSRSISAGTLTASRVYSLPDRTGNILVDNGTNTFSGATAFTGSATNTFTLNFNNLTTTVTDGAGILMQNSTPATGGATVQNAPYLTFSGNVWDGVSATKVVNLILKAIPNVSSVNTDLVISMKAGAGAYSDQFKFLSSGEFDILSSSATIKSTGGPLTVSTGTAGDVLNLLTIGDGNANSGVNIKASATITSSGVRSLGTVSGTFQNSAGAGVHRGINNTLTVNYTSTSTATLTFYDASLTVTSILAGNTIYGYRSQIASGTGTRWNIYADGSADSYFAARIKFGTVSTGSGSAALGANSPASTLTAPYTWINAVSSDGSIVYIPCWK